MTAHFPQISLQLAYERQPKRPTKLHQLDVFSNYLAILSVELLKPPSNRFISSSSTKEENRQHGLSTHAILLYLTWYTVANYFSTTIVE